MFDVNNDSIQVVLQSYYSFRRMCLNSCAVFHLTGSVNIALYLILITCQFLNMQATNLACGVSVDLLMHIACVFRLYMGSFSISGRLKSPYDNGGVATTTEALHETNNQMTEY